MKKLFKYFKNMALSPFKGFFSQLLISLIFLFVLRPYDRGVFYTTIWEILLVFVFLSAIFNCNHSKKVKYTAIFFGLPAIILKWINLLVHNNNITLIFILCIIIFIFITTSSIIKQVLLNARVKLETLRGVVCAYFMVAFGFAFVYVFISLVNVNAFHFSNLDIELSSNNHHISELLYFSFVTLLTIGYGDVIANHDIGQTFAILEGIIGQFYIAILVSRLVAVYSFYEHKLHLVSKKK